MANATTVLKVYAHEIMGQEDRTRKAIDAMWTAATDAAGQDETHGFSRHR